MIARAINENTVHVRDCQDSLLNTGGLGVVEGRINVDSTRDHSFWFPVSKTSHFLTESPLVICPAEWFYCASCEVLIHEMKLDPRKKRIRLREQLVLCSMTVSAIWERINNSSIFSIEDVIMYSNLWAQKKIKKLLVASVCLLDIIMFQICVSSSSIWKQKEKMEQ